MNTLANPGTNTRSIWLKFQMELLFWMITALFTYLIINPLLVAFENPHFLYINVLFIVVFVTYTRYIFLLKYTFLAYLQWLKFILIFASIPLVFYMVQFIQQFQAFLDDEGLLTFHAYFKADLDFDAQQTLMNYMRREYIFFGVGAIISATIFPFRLLVSFWRVYNKTGNV